MCVSLVCLHAELVRTYLYFIYGKELSLGRRTFAAIHLGPWYLICELLREIMFIMEAIC